MVSEVNVVGNAVESSICEKADNAPVIVVILAGSIGIEKPQPDHGSAESLLEIHDLNFIDPFRDGVIIVLNDGMIERNILRQNMLVLVAINFR